MNASIELKLFHLKREGAPFDPDKFYRTILTGDGDDYNEEVGFGVPIGRQTRGTRA